MVTDDSPQRGELVPADFSGSALTEYGWYGGLPAKPAILTAGLSPLGIWHAFRRRWVLAIGIGILIAVGGVILPLTLMSVEYTARTFLRVKSSTPEILATTRRTQKDIEAFRATQAGLIRSDFVLTKVLRDPNVSNLPMVREYRAEEQLEWLKKSLKAEFLKGSEILEIRFSGNSQSGALAIVDAVKAAYFSEVVEKEKVRKQKQYDTISREHADRDKEYRKKLSALNRLFEEHGRERGELRHKLLVSQITRLAKEQFDTGRTILDLQLSIQGIKEQIKSGVLGDSEQALIDATENADVKLQTLKQQLLQLQNNLATKKAILVGENHPSLRRILGEIETMQDQIDERRQEIVLELQSLPRSGSAEAVLAKLESQLALQKQLYGVTANQIGEKSKQMKQIKRLSTDYTAKEKEVRQIGAVVERLAQRMIVIEIERKADPQIQSLGAEYVKDSGAAKYTATAVAGLMGLLIGISGITFFEFLARHISSVNDVSEGLGLAVAGSLPLLSSRAWKAGGARAEAMQAVLTDSIDAIRTSLTFGTSIDSPRVIIVTSAVAGEGKTTVASQLAASLARAGQRVVLVDADVRRPAAHELFERPLAPGLSEVLRDEVELDDVVEPTHVPGLWLVTAGHGTPESVQELAKEGVRHVFGALREKFDSVIVDTPALLSAADALLVGQHADGAVLSVLRDSSGVANTYEASERMKTVGITVLGAVVNGVTDKAHTRKQLADSMN